MTADGDLLRAASVRVGRAAEHGHGLTLSASEASLLSLMLLDAAQDAETIGSDYRAVRLAAALLGRHPDGEVALPELEGEADNGSATSSHTT